MMLQINHIMTINHIIAKAIQLGYVVKTYGDLHMLKTTDNVTQHTFEHHHLKGLIFTEKDDEDGQVNRILVAQGCEVPLELEPEPKDPEYYAGAYTVARDGISFRFYHYNGQWCSSTTGRIRADTCWGKKGDPTFEELLRGAIDQINFDLLDPAYCYYTILEHKDFTNIVKHAETTLTLVGIVEVNSLREHPVEMDKGFQHHEIFLDAPPSDRVSKMMSPLTAEDVGYVIHYTNSEKGDRKFRKETDKYKCANDIKPNLPEATQHWIYLYKSEDAAGAISTYLAFFPWHTELFESMAKWYKELDAKVTHDYRTSSGYFPKRNVRFMREMISDRAENVSDYLRDQDLQRIYYMINPNKLPVLEHSQCQA
jgi:hypothetical protein